MWVVSLTPAPLKNKQTRLNTNPSLPSTNLFTNPKQRTDRGTMLAKGIKAALNLSSGYHTPPRFLRHLITVRSEIRPIMVAPTVEIRLSIQGQNEKRFTNPCSRDPKVKNRHLLTLRWLCYNERPRNK